MDALRLAIKESASLNCHPDAGGISRFVAVLFGETPHRQVALRLPAGLA